MKGLIRSTTCLGCIHRQSLIRVKQPRPDAKKKGVVYEVSCKDCECEYIGETWRTLQKCLSKHRTAVKKHNKKNGIACCACMGEPTHSARDLEGATVRQQESHRSLVGREGS